MSYFSFSAKALMAALVTATLAACGGSVSELVLHGVVASGAALSNATVTVVCAASSGSGTTTSTGTTDANGNYTVTAPNGKPPCLLTATKTVGSVTVTLNSIAVAEGVVNITPVTNMVVLGIKAAKGATTLADLVTPAYSPGPTDMASAQAAVLTVINAALVTGGKPALPVGTNLVTDASFAPGPSNTMDVALDNLTLIGKVSADGAPDPTLQANIDVQVDAVVPPNPPGATGGT